jgi:hypothetical protein
MDTFRSHSDIDDVAANLLRACVVAVARTVGEQACQGILLWLNILGASRPTLARTPLRPVTANAPSNVQGLSPASWAIVWPWVWPPHVWSGAHMMNFSRTEPSQFWASPVVSAWQPLAGWAALGNAYWLAWGHQLAPALMAGVDAIAHTAPHTAIVAGYPSYRSADGHAVAQVIKPAGLLAAGLPPPPRSLALGVTHLQ